MPLGAGSAMVIACSLLTAIASRRSGLQAGQPLQCPAMRTPPKHPSPPQPPLLLVILDEIEAGAMVERTGKQSVGW